MKASLVAVGLLLATFTLGARPARAAGTINVELDWMQDLTHSHRPAQAEIDAVVQMYATHGITLNVVIDQAVPEITTLVDGPNPNDFFSATGPGTYNSIKSVSFQHLGQAGWHYCLFGHDYTEDGRPIGSSGLATRPGYDLIVTLGSFANEVGTPWDRASTFAHELGHNMGLNHGGSKNPVDVGNSPPVYASVMSYAYQLNGVRTHMQCLGLASAWNRFKDLDYSNGRMPDVNEGALDEAIGLGMSPVDWNCNGVVSGVVAHDLDEGPANNNSWCDAVGPANQDLGDWNDWVTVQSVLNNSFLAKVPEQHEPCATASDPIGIATTTACSAPQPVPTIEPAMVGEMEFVNPAFGGLVQIGTGNNPFTTFAAAYGTSPANSVIYLRPGTYSVGAGVLSKAMTVSGPGAALLVP